MRVVVAKARGPTTAIFCPFVKGNGAVVVEEEVVALCVVVKLAPAVPVPPGAIIVVVSSSSSCDDDAVAAPSYVLALVLVRPGFDAVSCSEG